MSHQCSHQGCNENNFENWKCIFHCEKNTWYTEIKDEKGNITKDWSQEMIPSGKVTKFWEAIREKMEKEKSNDFFDFSGFIFPEFEKVDYNNLEYKKKKEEMINYQKEKSGIYIAARDCNFWKSGKEIVFRKSANFDEVNFLGKVHFQNIKFLDFMSFCQTIFFDDAIFEESILLEKINFENAKFLNHSHFCETIFLKNINFKNTKFLKTAEFIDAKFAKVATFYQTIFSKNVNFSGSIFVDLAEFSDAEFLGSVTFNNTSFLDQVYFLSTKFSNKEQAMFNRTKFDFFASDLRTKKLLDSVSFNWIFFPDKVVFRSCDLSRTSFLHSNIEKVRFDECEWGKLKTKTIKTKNKEKKVEFCHDNYRDNQLWDEYSADKEKDSAIKFRQIENLYRQLKKNFDDKKDNQTADDFYVGEMEMRKIALKKEGWLKNFGKWLFLSLYRLISYYNSDPFQALWCLVIVIGISHLSFLALGVSWTTAFHFAFTGGIPLLGLPVKIQDISSSQIAIYYTEVIFSSIVWALLILSIRQKFRR